MGQMDSSTRLLLTMSWWPLVVKLPHTTLDLLTWALRYIHTSYTLKTRVRAQSTLLFATAWCSLLCCLCWLVVMQLSGAGKVGKRSLAGHVTGTATHTLCKAHCAGVCAVALFVCNRLWHLLQVYTPKHPLLPPSTPWAMCCTRAQS